MSAGDAVARMLTMVPWLLERPGASVEEAAEAFGVPPRTIRRDLSHLDFCGLPGLGGGTLFDVTLEQDRVVVSMADELRRPLRLTPREALRLVLSLQAVDEALGEEMPALRSAIDKVRRAADLPVGAAVAVGEGQSGWVAELRRALRDGVQVRLGYQGRTDDAPRDRVVDPWQLDVTPEGWYLHGLDVEVDDHRVYRLDRIGGVEVLTSRLSTPRPAEPLPTPRFDPGDDDIEIVVRLGQSARWVTDAIVHDTIDDDGETIELTFRTDAPQWVVRLLMMGAPDVEVLAPDHVATLLAREARAALDRYRDED